MGIKIALAGNPNCGKTTIFNELTGSSQYVGNWPGVTVEKKEGKLKGHKDVTIVDLPGIYSLSPYTLEEVVTRNFLIDERPDVIINIVDGSNIERNLYLTTQLVELGIPVVIALNMMDVVNKNGDIINTSKLSKSLGCEVLETSALKGKGLKELSDKAVEIGKSTPKVTLLNTFSKDTEEVISNIEKLLKGNSLIKNPRWFYIKLFERDEKVLEYLKLDNNTKDKLDNLINNYEESLDDDAESIITTERYDYIGKIITSCVKKKNNSNLSTSDKIDKVVTNRWLALPIFALVMLGIYYIAVTTIGTIATDWVNDTLFAELIQGNVSNWLMNMQVADWLHGLIVDGIIGGVGAVLGFVPQIMVLFFLISLLEDCGYMARVAFIMDRIFRRFGLSGKSFIPMLIGSGCSVPAVMASRTIENDRDRKMTIMLTPFIPCSAKLPVFALLAGAFFPSQPWAAPSMYFLGIAMVILSGIILKKTKLFKGDPAPFVMELPQYRIPSLKGLLIHMWDRGKAFIIKAGTIIFVASGLIWFLQSFSWSLQMVDAQDSILASIGNVIAPIFAPLGFGNWQSAVATVTGFLAKENVVATFGVLFGLGAELTESDPNLVSTMGQLFNVVSAYSFMAFTLLAAPCFAAIGAIKREMGSWKWTFIAIGYQTGLAYVVSLIIYQVGRLIFL
ncbi:MAG: ferrous iron transport protein B [Clostridium sulfidigenes]|uniref:Ferrous iron transport protein B n=1 Tax=Clostridium sulfidigenes TaxID=318464 RepID=A0A927W683_9CLOT|nr:ferrous iron transport protein B [Clostridium sulfidigenes]